MDRRKYLKTLALGTVTTGALLEGCALAEKQDAPAVDLTAAGPDRQPSTALRLTSHAERSRSMTNEHRMSTF